ncbi:MAG: rod shape-determining protein MreD [Flavobacteriales bacterium]|nr:rod shape-determining protein MreD [Flavobacteriales bacterium]
MKSNEWFIFGLKALLLVAVQVLIIDHLNLNQYMFPQIYIMLLMSLPINLPHWQGYVAGFLLGALADSFGTPGLHSFTCVFMMFFRHQYFSRFVDKEWLATGIRPNFNNTDRSWYLLYMPLFVFIFHFILLSLESFSFHHFVNTLLKIIYSSSLAIFLILLFQFSFNTVQQDGD